MTWVIPDKQGGCFLFLHIQPGAKKEGVAGTYGNALKICLAARATDGKANAALLSYLAACLKVPKTSLAIIRGEKSREKTVRAAGKTPEAVVAALFPLLNTNEKNPS
ncbi:MAG: DUF167 domain-containing protein [Zoogloeaceae bacterium]|jgi:uncharacterized protein (TIGR00251 family)|nr:DUF167 domain-containing protein [Zoogloeaceae bacterium]